MERLQERMRLGRDDKRGTGFGGCVIWPLRVMLCLKTGGQL